jgi:flagellar motor switch protein FliG
MELKKTQIENAIEILKNADGEDLQNILEIIGMDEQVLKQLIHTKMYRLKLIMDDAKAIKQFFNENDLN